MIIVSRHGDIISGSYNGKTFGIAYDPQKWALMKDLEAKAATVDTVAELKPILEDFAPLTVESYKELVESKSPWIWVNKATNKFYLKLNEYTISSKPLPKAFVDRILTSVDKMIDVQPLVKCWMRFLRNPNYSDAKAVRFAAYINKTYVNQELVAELMNKSGLSHEAAVARATSTQVSITEEGLIVGYKVSREIDWKFTLDEDGNPKKKKRYQPSIDEISGVIKYEVPAEVEDRVFQPALMDTRGDEFSCAELHEDPLANPGHVIRVGRVHALKSWDMVNCDDNQTGKPGLHVGGLAYIRGFQYDDTLTHYVFIDPMHIGAVADIDRSDSDGALRVKQYFVQSSFAGVNRGIYHSSKYGAITDLEFEAMLKEAIELTGKLEQEHMDEGAKQLKEKHALVTSPKK